MSHLGNVERWIKERLMANPVIVAETQGVHNTAAIQGEPTPYVIVTLRNDAPTERTLCNTVASVRFIYDVVVTSQDTGFTNVESIEDAINETLAPQYVPASGDRARFYVSVVALARRIQQGESSQIFRAGGTFEFLILP